MHNDNFKEDGANHGNPEAQPSYNDQPPNNEVKDAGDIKDWEAKKYEAYRGYLLSKMKCQLKRLQNLMKLIP